nr:anti-sigma factor antagonist [Bacteroidota bacterium]
MNFSYDIKVGEGKCVISLIEQLVEPHQGDDLLLALESLINKGINQITLDILQLSYFNNTAIELFSEILNVSRRAGGDCLLVGLNETQSSADVIQKLSAIFENNVSV